MQSAVQDVFMPCTLLFRLSSSVGQRLTFLLVSAQSNISWIWVTAPPPSGATSPPDMIA